MSYNQASHYFHVCCFLACLVFLLFSFTLVRVDFPLQLILSHLTSHPLPSHITSGQQQQRAWNKLCQQIGISQLGVDGVHAHDHQVCLELIGSIPCSTINAINKLVCVFFIKMVFVNVNLEK
jgi:hypothetical protein